MLLSIIIPLYNSENYIVKCIDSCFQQGLQQDEFEVIIINDGSTDRSLKIIEEHFVSYYNLRVYTQKNLGQGAARNYGINKARGKYIMFLDSDDFYLPGTIKRILNIAELMSCEVLNFLMEVEHSDGSIEAGYRYNYDFNRVYSGEEVLLHIGVNVGTVCSSIYLRDFILQNSLCFPTDMKHEDVYFSYQVYSYASSIVFTNIHCYFYNWNENSTDRSEEVSKRRNLQKSDLLLAYHLKVLSGEEKINSRISQFLKATSNSILISLFLISLKGEFLIGKKEFKRECSLKHLYPMKGWTNSWKTSMLQPFFNILLFFF